MQAVGTLRIPPRPPFGPATADRGPSTDPTPESRPLAGGVSYSWSPGSASRRPRPSASVKRSSGAVSIPWDESGAVLSIQHHKCFLRWGVLPQSLLNPGPRRSVCEEPGTWNGDSCLAGLLGRQSAIMRAIFSSPGCSQPLL